METEKRNQVEWTVTRPMLADAVGSGALPVFATPMCVALLENAAAALVAGELEDGMTTVGTRMEINHIAATPEGMKVRGEAVLVAVEGRKYTFTVAAYDETEKIAEGLHERFAVNADRFQQKTKDKAGRQG